MILLIYLKKLDFFLFRRVRRRKKIICLLGRKTLFRTIALGLRNERFFFFMYSRQKIEPDGYYSQLNSADAIFFFCIEKKNIYSVVETTFIMKQKVSLPSIPPPPKYFFFFLPISKKKKRYYSCRNNEGNESIF